MLRIKYHGQYAGLLQETHECSFNFKCLPRPTREVPYWNPHHCMPEYLKRKTFLSKAARGRFVRGPGDCRSKNALDFNSAQRTEYSWTALISQHTKCGEARKALQIYEQMRKDGVDPSSHTFIALLKACSSLQDLESTKWIHAEVVKNGFESNLYVTTMLVDVYAKCRSLVDARHTFEHMPQRDVVSWTAIILGYAQMDKGEEALQLYTRMQHEGVVPDARTYVSALKACVVMAELGGRNEGDGILWKGRCLETIRAIHADITKCNLGLGVFVGTMLVDAYAKCGSLEDARRVFDNMPRRDVVSWNAMILGYSQMDKGVEALQLYTEMQQKGVVCDARSYISALKACSTLADSGKRSKEDSVSVKQSCLEAVKAIHTDVLKRKFETDVFVGTMLVDAYSKCGSLEDARRVFEKIFNRSVVSWNAMILGYAQLDKGEDALQLYTRMQQEGVLPNDRTYVSVLKACSSIVESRQRNYGDLIAANEQCLKTVRAIHRDILKGRFESDLFVGNMLVDAYAKCGSLEDSKSVFEKLPRRDVVSWNTMILGYAQMNKGEEALQLYTQMQQDGVVPNDRTYVCALKACSTLVDLGKRTQGDVMAIRKRCLKTVRAIHTDILKGKLEADMFVGNMLVDAYAKCGSLEDSKLVFEKMRHDDVVSWNAMILGYAEMDKAEEALRLYTQMQAESVEPDGRTYVSALKACSSLAEVAGKNDDGTALKGRCLEMTVRSIHRDVVRTKFESDVFVGSMLVDVYAKCGCLEEARHVFEELPHRDVVCWTAMILGYAQDKGTEALQLFTRMQQEGVVPDSRTFVGALSACGHVAGLEKGKEIHAQILRSGPGTFDFYVAASLIDMYGKCGSMVDAQQVFDALPRRDLGTWNTLIAGYAHQGQSEVVFDLFHRMQQAGLQPDSKTFLGLLTVCSYVGLLDKGQQYFNAMSTDFGITPTIKHFTCIVDLLGRSGQLGEAMEMVEAMPFQPDSAMWQCVLGACTKWGYVDLGRKAFDCATKLNKDDAAAYVMMSNIFEAAHMHEEAKEVQAMRANSQAWKQPGLSWWTDESGNAHVFCSQGHPESQDAFAKRDDLLVQNTNMC